jgi:hypothetical protein
VITKYGCRSLSLVTMLVLLVSTFTGSVLGREQPLYVVGGDDIQIYVEGFAIVEPPNDPETAPMFTLTRTAEDDTPIYFSLSSLEDDGNAFPREMVVVKNAQDSEWQAFASSEGHWNSYDSEICLLPSGQSHSEVFVALRGEVGVRAGTYEGMISSPHGPSVPIQITVGRHTMVSGNPQDMYIAVGQGPGWYDADPLQLVVAANHGDWVVTISSEGLFYQDDQYQDVLPMMLYIKSDERVPLTEPYQINGHIYNWGVVMEIELQTEATWKHPAGDYQGTVFFDVHLNE